MREVARLPLVALVAALIGAVAPESTRAESRQTAGTVTAITGTVTVTRPQATPQPLKFRQTLYWRDVVEAGKDGIARLLLGGKTTVTVRELSRLELREEKVPTGVRYTAELVAGKVRASVARMLMRPGDQVEVRTRNAVASVRGTDFIVETAERPGQAWPFGLLGVQQVAEGVGEDAARSKETTIITLSGIVEVSNRLAGTGRVGRVAAYEAVRVSGRRDPTPLHVQPADVKLVLQGLTPPRPQ